MPHDDEKTIREKLADAGLYSMGITPVGGGDTLHRYEVVAQQDLRRAFEILDGVDDIRPAMLAEVEVRADVFDKPAKRHGFTSTSRTVRTNNYINAIVQASKDVSHAKADLIFSHVHRIINMHNDDYHS
tara:strand:- start:39 stop:425 length:387 start_codon:yes stop_codon:yes gene_type:complete